MAGRGSVMRKRRTRRTKVKARRIASVPRKAARPVRRRKAKPKRKPPAPKRRATPRKVFRSRTKLKRRPLSRFATISYPQGSLKIAINKNSTFRISSHRGPVIGGTPRAVKILPPYARVATSAIGDFKAGAAKSDEFFIGTVEVMDRFNSRTEFKFKKAIVMRRSAASDRMAVIPLSKAKMTFCKGTSPLGVDMEMSQDQLISSAKGPVVGGKGQQVTVFAPFVEMISGDVYKGFSAGRAADDAFYYGQVKVGNKLYKNAIVIRESHTSSRYAVMPVSMK